MRQRSISKGRSKGICYSDEEEVEYDTAIREYRSSPCACGCVVAEVEVADCSCEEGLEGIEEDGEFKEFGGGGIAIWCRG